MKNRWFAVAVVAALSVTGSVPGAQDVQNRQFEYNGVTFEIAPLQGNEAVFEITYGEIRGYLGVPDDATPELPYGFATVYPNVIVEPHAITPVWLSGLGKCAGDDCFDRVGAAMLETLRGWTAYQASLDTWDELKRRYRQETDELESLVSQLPQGR